MDKLLLKIPEVCETLGLGRSTVYQLLDQPDGLATVRIGRAIRVPLKVVNDWADRQCSKQAEVSESRLVGAGPGR